MASTAATTKTRSGSSRRRRPTMLGVRLLPEEVAQVDRLIDSEKITRAALLRRALLKELARSA